MSAFTALNVEPEDAFEEEIDDTKEIQIEEAFKLYQNALKLHSQGPSYYSAAEKAYDELFQSEVFKYPEVVTEYGHEQLDDTIVATILPGEQDALPVIASNAADSAANSLPQLIYLSYKNRGQFVLDVARQELHTTPPDRRSTCLYYYKYCLKSLQDSASALERDDTDLDLWKKAARISDVLASQRLVRFCLESVLAGDDEGTEQTIDLSGLDEAFASGELSKVLRVLQDDLSIYRSPNVHAQHKLLQLLQKSNDPYPFLPQRSLKLEYLGENQRPNHFQTAHTTITPAGQTQEAFADSFIQALNEQDGTDSDSNLGLLVKISIPMTIDAAALGVSSGTVFDTTVVGQTDNTTAQLRHENISEATKEVSSDDSTNSPTSYHSAADEMKPEAQTIAPKQDNTSEQAPDQSVAVEEADDKSLQEQTQPEVRLPTRKRSSTMAGNEEPESRTKSKRLRARESLLEMAAQEEEAALENDYYLREQLALIEHDDRTGLDYVQGLLSRASLSDFFEADDLQLEISQKEGDNDTSTGDGRQLLKRDMRHVLTHWTEDTSNAIMSGHGSRDVTEKSGGLSLFQRHLKANLPVIPDQANSENDERALVSFSQKISQSEHTLAELIFIWLLQLLTSTSGPDRPSSPYLCSHWSDEMRENVMRLVLQIDHYLCQQIEDALRPAGFKNGVRSLLPVEEDKLLTDQITELTLTVFEIHLDKYYCLSSTENRADQNLLAEQMDRLQRWHRIATDAIQIRPGADRGDDSNDPLVLRFILSSALLTGLLSGNDKSHILSCLSDVQLILEKAGKPVINLPNNKAMPQVSLLAVEQEISRLNTLDFFNSVFDSESDDAVSVIMKLEPVLEPEQVISEQDLGSIVRLDDKKQTQLSELRAFLDSGDASLKLFLWRRLQNGYSTISYIPKVVSCLLRSLEIIVQEIRTERHGAQPPRERQFAMLRWLRDADEIVAKVLLRVSEESTAFETLDEKHLVSSLSAVATMLELLYLFAKFDDSIRVGQTQTPTFRTNTAQKTFEKCRDKLRDSFVRGWTLMYHLMKETTAQIPEQFEHASDQLAEYLRLVHNLLGHRQYCKQSNKLFIKLAKSELLSINSNIDYSEDIAQVLYDLYQIRLGSGFGDVNHGCSPDLLGRDKDTAFNLVPVIMTYARKLSMRDLIKNDLRTTIDKIQQTLGQGKGSPALSFNKKSISSFLKSPINPQDVYRSLKGLGDLMTKPVSGEYARVAAQGWYQIIGRMSLAKYKSIKRVNPTPTDELDVAGTYLRLDLEYNTANWESWYRLAQVLDAKIEDSLIWNSLKLNDSRGDIATLERNAINAYTMAIAMAMRNANDSAETVQKISDMFSEFAFRLYASSRPPLSMEAFGTDKYMRHLSNSQDRSMSKTPFIQPFRDYAVWGFAAYLLQRKFAAGQKEWMCHYTSGKCFWKMYQSSENVKAKRPIQIEDVLDAFIDAVGLVPKKEKSNDPILEPHYKLVSVVHKMVCRKLLPHAKAVEYLQATQFARGVHLSEDEQGPEWESYVLEILKKLGNADKSNWHHRITARAAHVIYDDDPDVANALGAKHQFTQQIFTKTMTMQVWKPENERPGRHYVYTGTYLKFFVHLLDQVNDRTALEQLVRRIRRKTTDFLDHAKIWEETALTYVKLLRRVGKVPEGQERSVFDKISYDDFAKMSERVENTVRDPDNNFPFQDIVQDAVELKKLNNSLMKGPAIDDLIGDAYACMYEAFVSQLPPEEAAPSKRDTLPQGTFINMNTDVVPTGDDNLDRMRLNNLLSAQADSITAHRASMTNNTGLGFQTPPAATPPAEVRIPTPSKPGRAKTITRREVQRKAEACIIKPPPIKTPTLAKRPFVDLSGRRDSAMSNAQDETDNEKNRDESRIPDSSRVSSRNPSTSPRGSAEPENTGRDQDDDNDGEADDESELSEVDNDADDESEKDQGEAKTGFPQPQDRKRKAEDEANDDAGSQVEGSEDEENDRDGDGEDVSGFDGEQDAEDVEEPEDSTIEIQDSQDAGDRPAEAED